MIGKAFVDELSQLEAPISGFFKSPVFLLLSSIVTL
jgi:hypothetical protein